MKHNMLRNGILRGTLLWGLAVLTSCAAVAAAGTETGWPPGRGFFFGGQYNTDLIGAEDPGPGSDPNQLFFDEVGHGLLLHVGYSVSPAVALRLAGSAARHGTTQEGVEADNGSLVLEAHYRFLPGERARPYLFGGFGGTTIRVSTGDFDTETRGGVVDLGAGIFYGLTRHLYLDLAGRLDLVNWNEIRVTKELADGTTLELKDPVDDSGSEGRFLLGILWQF